jgi:hypothetical protein
MTLDLKQDCGEGAFDRVGVAEISAALDQLIDEVEEHIDAVDDLGDAPDHLETDGFVSMSVHHGGRRTAVSKTKQ